MAPVHAALSMDPAFAAHTEILARRKKPKKAKPEKVIPTAGRDLNERALSKAAAAAREPGAPEPDEEEEDWYTTALAIEASTRNGSSRRLHNGKGGKSSTAGSAASESVVVNTREQAFALDFHPSRKLLVTGLINGQLKLYDYAGAKPSKTSSSRPHHGACRAVKFAPGGGGVFSGSSDCSLQLRDLETNKPSWRQKAAHAEPLNALVLSGPNGVATGDDGGSVKVWDVRQRSVALSFCEHCDLVNDMLYVEASDGPTLCVASGDGCLSIYDLRRGRLAALSDNQEDEIL